MIRRYFALLIRVKSLMKMVVIPTDQGILRTIKRYVCFNKIIVMPWPKLEVRQIPA